MSSHRSHRGPLLTLVVALMGGLALVAPASAAPTAAPARAVTRAPLDILVVGDSYSAGNGATDASGAAQTYGPSGCYRSKVGWAELYAAGLRSQGHTVNVSNHACSGGKAPDIFTPRVKDTATGKSTSNPEGATTLAEADAYLARLDPCNTKQFPDEEFWTYKATAVDSSKIDYDCSRNLRPQADFVTPDTDLVVFTMGGNDAGFTTIVTQCFIMKSGSGCQAAIDAARAKLPEIKQLLLQGVTALRAAGLRDDAKIVQLGYPYLQTDNGYVAAGVPPYPAGDAVRSLIDDGTAALATVPTDANVGHPGQMTFVGGIKEAFAGHEPDATTPVGNPDRWVNQTADGTDTNLWYHPRREGQIAYAQVLIRGGDYGATPAAPTQSPTAVRTTLRVRLPQRRVRQGDPVTVVSVVRNSDGTVPRGRLQVGLLHREPLKRVPVAAGGRTTVRLTGLRPGTRYIKVVLVSGPVRRVGYATVLVRRR